MLLMDDQAQPRHIQTDSVTGLLHKSECFLRKHDLGRCYKYALKAQKSNPSLPGAAQLIAIVATLRTTRSTNRPDWYEILSLPSSNVEQHVVEKRLSLLKGFLNPAENPYPYAADALEWVLRAGSVLCDPIRRAYFDKNGGTFSFWTACPYCHRLYEYENLFEECFLRCQNEKCRRAFTAVPIVEKAEPLPEVLEKGEYLFHRFYPLVWQEGAECEREEWKWWSRVSSMVPGIELPEPEPEPEPEPADDDMTGNGWEKSKAKNRDDVIIIEISDDENDSKESGTFGNDDAEIDEVEKEGTPFRKRKENEGVEEENNGGTLVIKRRKKMVRGTDKEIDEEGEEYWYVVY